MGSSLEKGDILGSGGSRISFGTNKDRNIGIWFYGGVAFCSKIYAPSDNDFLLGTLKQNEESGTTSIDGAISIKNYIISVLEDWLEGTEAEGSNSGRAATKSWVRAQLAGYSKSGHGHTFIGQEASIRDDDTSYSLTGDIGIGYELHSHDSGTSRKYTPKGTIV